MPKRIGGDRDDNWFQGLGSARKKISSLGIFRNARVDRLNPTEFDTTKYRGVLLDIVKGLVALDDLAHKKVNNVVQFKAHHIVQCMPGEITRDLVDQWYLTGPFVTLS